LLDPIFSPLASPMAAFPSMKSLESRETLPSFEAAKSEAGSACPGFSNEYSCCQLCPGESEPIRNERGLPVCPIPTGSDISMPESAMPLFRESTADAPETCFVNSMRLEAKWRARKRKDRDMKMAKAASAPARSIALWLPCPSAACRDCACETSMVFVSLPHCTVCGPPRLGWNSDCELEFRGSKEREPSGWET